MIPTPLRSIIYLISPVLLLCNAKAWATDPAWWSQSTPPVIINPSPPGANNGSPANIGQAKWIALSALNALRSIAPDVAEQVEGDLVGEGKPIASWDVPEGGSEANPLAALTIGQLKAISAPFYTRLNELSPSWLLSQRTLNQTSFSGSIFPWTTTTADDNNAGMASIGQLKAAFALRFEMDADEDGMSDLWEANFARSILATSPKTPAQWQAEGLYNGLVAGDLAASSVYTDDQMTASAHAAQASNPPASGVVTIEKETKVTMGDAFTVTPVEGDAYTIGEFFHQIYVDNQFDFVTDLNPTSPDFDLTESQVLSFRAGAPFYNTSGWSRVNVSSMLNDMSAVANMYWDFSVSGDLSQSYIFQSSWTESKRIRIYRDPAVPLSKAIEWKFIKVTTTSMSLWSDHGGSQATTALEEVTITIPAGSQVSAYYELEPPVEEDRHNICYLVSASTRNVSFGGAKYWEVWKDGVLGNNPSNVPVADKYTAPHWVSADGDDLVTESLGERNSPVAFTRNSYPTVGANFLFTGLLNHDSVKIKASGPDGFEIAETSPSFNEITGLMTLPMTSASAPIVNTAKLYDKNVNGKAFTLHWKLKMGSSAWVELGTTKHTVYVTLNDPASMLIGPTSVTYRQESLFLIGCRSVDGETTDAGVAAKIWSTFASLSVRGTDGKLMTYYKSPDPRDKNGSPVLSCDKLIQVRDGQCGSWADLFIRTRQIQGLGGAKHVLITPIKVGETMLVKNWSFTGAGIGGDYPYQELFGEHYEYTGDVTDLVGEGGQGGISDPISKFENHQVVLIGGTGAGLEGGQLYDPSYGKVYSDLLDFDTRAIDGYSKNSTQNFSESGPPAVDLNGDEDTDDVVSLTVRGYRKNPATLDLKHVVEVR